jgi:hypothetical protein
MADSCTAPSCPTNAEEIIDTPYPSAPEHATGAANEMILLKMGTCSEVEELEGVLVDWERLLKMGSCSEVEELVGALVDGESPGRSEEEGTGILSGELEDDERTVEGLCDGLLDL